MSRMRSIKVLDFAMSTPEGAACCVRFVDVFGLKTLFSTFMRKGAKKLKKSYKSYSESEEEGRFPECLPSPAFSLIICYPVECWDF